MVVLLYKYSAVKFFREISDNKVNRTDYFQSIILLSKIMKLDEFYFFRRKL